MKNFAILLLLLLSAFLLQQGCSSAEKKLRESTEETTFNNPDTLRRAEWDRVYEAYLDSLTRVMIKKIMESLEKIKYNSQLAKQIKDNEQILLDPEYDPDKPVDKHAYDVGMGEAYRQESRALFRRIYPNLIEIGEQGGCVSQVNLNAQAVVEGAHFTKNGHSKGDFEHFSQALFEVMTTTLEALRQSQPNGPTYFQEKVEGRYARIHEPLARLLYEVQTQYLSSRNNPPYPDFSHYRSTEAFLFAYTSAIGTVIDAVFTDAYADWGDATRAGTKIFGSSFRCALEGVAVNLAKQLFEQAMILDLEQNKRALERNIRQYFKHRVVEERGDTLPVSKAIHVSNNFQVDLEMEIITYLDMGLGKTTVEFDHPKRMIRVLIPPEPRMIKKIMQNYVVRNAHVSCDDCEDALNLIIQSGTKLLSQQAISRVYSQNRIPVKELSIYTDPFTMDVVKAAIKDDLQKILEPFCIMLRHSGYEAEMVLGGETEPLIEHPKSTAPTGTSNIQPSPSN